MDCQNEFYFGITSPKRNRRVLFYFALLRGHLYFVTFAAVQLLKQNKLNLTPINFGKQINMYYVHETETRREKLTTP